jgi:hypothetical protein
MVASAFCPLRPLSFGRENRHSNRRIFAATLLHSALHDDDSEFVRRAIQGDPAVNWSCLYQSTLVSRLVSSAMTVLVVSRLCRPLLSVAATISANLGAGEKPGNGWHEAWLASVRSEAMCKSAMSSGVLHNAGAETECVPLRDGGSSGATVRRTVCPSRKSANLDRENRAEIFDWASAGQEGQGLRLCLHLASVLHDPRQLLAALPRSTTTGK